MVDCSRRPGRGAVALIAAVREVLGNMARCILEIRTVARIARGRQARKHAPRMALCAGQAGMAAGQGEGGMVDDCRRPGDCAVTLRTVVRIVLSNMVRSILEVGGMARIAVARQSCKGSSRMTLRTAHPGMASRQRKERVINNRRRPAANTMALGTIVRVILRNMIRSTLITGGMA